MGSGRATTKVTYELDISEGLAANLPHLRHQASCRGVNQKAINRLVCTLAEIDRDDPIMSVALCEKFATAFWEVR